MSRPLHERLRDLESDVRDLEMRPAAEVRERGRSRGRRRLAVVAVAGAVVLATAGVAVAWPAPRGGLPAAGPQVAGSGTPVPGQQAFDCSAMLPRSPSEVRVRVVDSGAPPGVAAEVAAELRERDYGVVDGGITEVAVGNTSVTHGPSTVGDALLVMAAIRGRAAGTPDPARDDDVVVLAVGSDFDRLTTPTELNQALLDLGRPTRPAECR